MMRSLFSGVSGIKVHQTRMDVIGNNIANINTIGFKSSRTTFSDMLSQLQSSSSAPTDGRGGVNANQIGLGVNVESVDIVFTDSSPQQTGKNTDLALSGNGLFYLRDGNQSYYTRNGAFMFDESGYYVMPGNGLRVQGWNAAEDGTINTNGTATDIIVPVGKTMEATATSTIDYSGNFDKESLLIDKIIITPNTANGVSLDQAVEKVCTGKSDEITSVNVDGENVLAARLVMKDGSEQQVTSGYYEVGRSIPITTLATVYDSLGGRHEVTVLIDKDPTSADTGINQAASLTSTGTNQVYTDADGIERILSVTDGKVYEYTPAGATTPTRVSEDKVVSGVLDGNTVYPATTNTDPVYVDDDGNYYGEDDVTATAWEPNDGSGRTVTQNDDGTYRVDVEEGDVTVTAGTITIGEDQVTLTRQDDGTYSRSDGGAAYATWDAAETAGATATAWALTEDLTTEVLQDDSGYYYNVEESEVTATAWEHDGTAVQLADDPSEAVKYTINGATRYTAADNLKDYTDVNGNYTEVTEVTDTDSVYFNYTDVNGNTYYISRTDEGVTARPAYDNRWRAYLAPQVGEKGPASEDFENKISYSESDGTTVEANMNYSQDDEGNESWAVSYLYFDSTGQFVTNGRSQQASIDFSYGNGNGAGDNTATIDFGGLTQYANNTTSFPITNGNAAGILQSLAVDGNGIISGTYTNGLVRAEAQLAVAQFSNSAGLTKVGTTIYQESNNSGLANVKTIGDFGLSVISSALEMSNVDLATEFSDMIITQRGFQANSKVTTVSDEMLETLVNMKR